ncbi:MAG: chemotaxis protein CheC [Ignavibacteria bacterium]|nr:chemotaxis protein CheC [Ignavibacteria bacterium]
MLLTERQKDAIAEIINISFSRAAKSLNELTGSRVIISVPKIELIEVDELENTLKNYIVGEVTTIHQVFNGQVDGDALLIFDKEGSKNIVKILLKEESSFDELNEAMREVITEVGNIVLSACLSMFGNLLNVKLKFSVPKISLDSLSQMLKTFEFDRTEIRYALVIFMEFSLEGTDIKGFLVLIMGVTSLEKFIAEIDKLG